MGLKRNFPGQCRLENMFLLSQCYCDKSTEIKKKINCGSSYTHACAYMTAN